MSPIPIPHTSPLLSTSLLQTSDRYGLIYVVTKLGLLFVYDLETATAIYRSRISPEPVFIASASETTGGFYAINRKGQVRQRACLLLLLLLVLLRCAIIAAPIWPWLLIWPRLPIWSQPLQVHHKQDWRTSSSSLSSPSPPSPPPRCFWVPSTRLRSSPL